VNETEIKTLDILANEIGNTMSISTLTTKIKEIHGNADYKNIHNSIQKFVEKNIVELKKNGNSSIPKLNFGNYLLVDHLVQNEIIKRIKFLEKNKNYQIIFSELILDLKNLKQLKTILLFNLDENIEKNKIELLFILNGNEIKKETKQMEIIINRIKNKYNIEIEKILLEENIFKSYLISQESNLFNEILKNKIILLNAESFWINIKELITNGSIVKSEESTKINNISQVECIYNLVKFSYTELANESIQSKEIGLEFLITSILLKKEFYKYTNAIPVLLMKNKINFNYLIYLSLKYEVINKLLGILKAMNKLTPTKQISKINKELSKQKVKPLEVNIEKIKLKMSFYNILN